MKKNELKLLWPFYLTALAAGSFSVVLPVWIIFFQQKFSFIQISFALSVQSLAAILFEIPTGAVADVFGRKFSVVSGIALQGLLWLVFPFISLDVLLYCAFFLMGFLRTLESGADKAWIIDWLKCNKGGNLIHDMLIKIQSLSSIGLMLSSLLATLLLCFFEIKILFLVQGCGYLFESLFLFFFAKESNYRKKKTRNKRLIHDALDTSQKGVKFMLNNKSLLYLVLAASFAVCSKDFGCFAWQPFLVNLTLPVEYLGMVCSIISLMGIVTPFFSKQLLRKIGHEKYYLALTTFIEFLFLLSLYFIDKPFFALGVIVYMFVSVITDLQSPVSSLYFQSLIPNKIRATMGSVQSMIFAVFSFILTIAGGYAMDKIGPKLTMILFSFFLVPATYFYLRGAVTRRKLNAATAQ